MKKGSLLLLLTAIIWGMAFVAQSVAMDSIGPWTFTCVRSFVAGITLLVLIPFIDHSPKPVEKKDKRMLMRGGILCGLCLAGASMFQQAGIVSTTVGKAGFITALYVVLVPVFSLFLGKRMEKKIWLSIILAVLGLYFLCMKDSFSLSAGDTLVMICAVMFAFHILVIDHYSPFVDGIRMSCIQFFVCGTICFVGMFLFEKPSLSAIVNAAVPILYAGILSSGAGYTMQIIGQRDTDPSIASLLLSLESVFAVIGGFLILHQALTIRELFGCLLSFGAVLLAELPVERLFQKRALHE